MKTQAEQHFAHPREAVFDFCVDGGNVVRFFKPYGPIPGVETVALPDNTPLAQGVRRMITTSDGVTMGEEMVVFEPPLQQTYRWGGELKPPFSWLVRSGTGHWTFDEANSGTVVRWTYTFTLTTPLVAPLMWPLKILFRRWMQRCLDGMCQGMDAE